MYPPTQLRYLPQYLLWALQIRFAARGGRLSERQLCYTVDAAVERTLAAQQTPDDIEAQRAALASAMETIAVLAQQVDILR